MLDRPFSDVCSTVSCWALLFSVILPSMQVMGVKVVAPTAAATSASPSSSSSDHAQHHLQKQPHHNHHHHQQFLLKTTTFSLTVYLDPTTFQHTLPMTFLSDPPAQSSSNSKKGSLYNSSWKEHLPNSRPKRSSIISRDVELPVAPVESTSKSILPLKRRARRGAGTSRTIVVDQSSAWSRSSLLPLGSDNSNNEHKRDATEQQEDRHMGRGAIKGPHRLSRHRYPHALIHRLYSGSNDNNINSPLESGSKTSAHKPMLKATRRIEVKKRPSRLQRLLLLDEQEKDDDHHHQQEQDQRQASADRDDLFNNPTDQELADMMNFFMDEGLTAHFVNLKMNSGDNNDNFEDSPVETNPDHQQYSKTPASSSSSFAPSVLSPSLSIWMQTDIDMTRALWDYWKELDEMDLIQAQLESHLDNGNKMDDMDNIDYETLHLRQSHYVRHRQQLQRQLQQQRQRRPESLTSDNTLWKGSVQVLIKDGPTNLSSPPLEWTQDDISGPMMRFPFSGPMPAMPQKWIALMPCPVIAIESAETPESNLGQKRQQQEIGRNPSLPLDATAIVFYATAEANCHGVYSDINDNNDSLPPFMVLDAQSAQNLLLTLDNLSYGTTALAALSNTEADSKATETKVDSVSIEMDDDEKDESAEAGTENIGATLSPAGSFDMKEVPKSSSRPSRRQIVISIPEIASMVESFTTGAAIRARRVLVTLGLDTQDDADEKFINGCNDRSRIMDDASYYRPLTSSMLLKTGGGVGAQKACFELDSEIGLHEQDRLNRENDDDKGTGSVPPILQRHSKTRTRPNRLPQRGHPASHSQLLDQVQSLMLLKEYPHHRGHQSIHHRLNPLHYNNNNLPLTHPNNTTLSGKVAMVLMSTVCGIGVGMFGALLFVVALKVRLFQSRRSNNSGGHLRNATAAQQQQAHQQLRESGLKKVIPLGVLESYGVQTVLQTSSATTILTAVSEKSKAKMALLSKGPKAYAENVIEMEEGLEDAEARENARRQRLERRRRLSGSGQLGLGRRIEENENENEEEEDSSSEEDSDDSNEDSGDADDSGSVEVHNRYRVLEHYSDYDYEEEGDQVVPVMRSTRGGLPDGGAMNMEQITAAIMTATGQGSYRRVSYSRQGHLNDSTTSLSSSYSTSSSSSSSGSSSGSSSSSRSMERALTSSFSSSLARTAEDPRGCTHSVTHSHQRKTTRKKQKSGTKTKKAETKTELPFANANAQTMCSICLAEYEVGEQVRTLPCYHQYHQGCIDPWLLNVAALCPICKRDLFPHGSAPPS